MNDRYLFRAKHSLESKKWHIGNLVEEPDGLYLRDNKAKELFDNMPWWYAKDSLLMQIGYGLNRTVSDQQWQYVLGKSFVQKLKYQYPQEWNESTDTIIGRVLREK